MGAAINAGLSVYVLHSHLNLNIYNHQNLSIGRIVQMDIDPILNGLNAAQRTAVTSPSSILQVLAPPGSGKTKTLTARVAYLLSSKHHQHGGFRPQDVICCTFTIKASREMRERLSHLIGDHVVSKLVLGTFHSICRRYLVAYGHLIGLKKGFGIADSNDSLAIIKVCL